jgi:hypothetical protein
MGDNVTMKAKDAVSAKLAECFVTIGTNRYNFMQMRNFEAKFEKQKQEVPVLGKAGRGNKSTGWKGTFSGNAYYNQSVMREMMLKFKDTGEDVYFDIQITNEDPTSAAGRQTMTFIDCNIDGGTLAKFDITSDDPLNEDINGTFEDFKMPEKFNLLDGMLTQ